ncbi:unnamed protein product [Staurois parvus]|uniref:Secreted protein n=1 Tax=Staurois parvus TaxID=386267 RepID=A0ABN9EZS4_9NEOB|nr:unnamed protein product [Staurois parvus]
MYVKWFDTGMFYYVILVNVTFCHFQISPHSVPVRPDARRGQNPEDRCRHLPEDITLQGDIAGAQDKVNDRGIAEQCRMVSPSVAQGYRLCYTREYLQGG